MSREVPLELSSEMLDNALEGKVDVASIQKSFNTVQSELAAALTSKNEGLAKLLEIQLHQLNEALIHARAGEDENIAMMDWNSAEDETKKKLMN